MDMSITPIEMYTMVPKSQEASNVRSGELARNASQQTGAMQNFEQQLADNTHRTVKMSETEYADYRYDAKEKGNGNYSSDDRKKDNKNKDSDKKAGPENKSLRPGGIDIRI